MPSWKLSIPAADLGRRLCERLQGDGATTALKFVWQRDAQHVLVHADSLICRFVDGWLLCSLDLETDQTKRQTLQFVFFIGKAGEGHGLQAACTINAPTAGAAQLAAAWGDDVQRVLWDAILDAIEKAVYLETRCSSTRTTRIPTRRCRKAGISRRMRSSSPRPIRARPILPPARWRCWRSAAA